MQRPRQAPMIARGPQNFAPSSMNPIPNPMGQPPMQQEPEADVSLEDELAMEIYCRLAVDHISHNHSAPNWQMLRELANSSKMAALAFFQEQPTNG